MNGSRNNVTISTTQEKTKVINKCRNARLLTSGYEDLSCCWPSVEKAAMRFLVFHRE